MEKIKFKIGSKVWFWRSEDYQSATVLQYDNEIDMYWLSDEDFHVPQSLYKSKRECAFDIFPPLIKK